MIDNGDGSMWDQRYDRDEYVYGMEPNDFLRSMADRIPKGPVLCLAEGEGRNAVFLAGLGHRVLGVDSSVVGLEKAQHLARTRGVQIETEVRDLNELDPGVEQWAAIVSIFCHLPRNERSLLHEKVERALRPGGILILEAYHPDQLQHGTGGPPMLERLVSLEELREELPGLDFVHAQEIEREVQEGLFHHGLGAVVQLLARKPT